MTYLGFLLVAVVATVWFTSRSKVQKWSDSNQASPIAERIETKVAAPRLVVESGQQYSSTPPPEESRVNKWVGWNFCGHLEVAGIQFRKADASFAFRNAKAGDFVELIREPTNSHDKNAISVWICSRHVGYIDKDVAKFASELLPADMPIRGKYISGYQSDAGFVRLTFLPQMPDVKSRRSNGWNVPSRS